MAYVPQPFPKMLYLDGACMTVDGAGAELQAKAAGWGESPLWTTEMAVAALEAPTKAVVEPEPVVVAPVVEVAPEPIVAEPEPVLTPTPPVARPSWSKGRRR